MRSVSQCGTQLSKMGIFRRSKYLNVILRMLFFVPNVITMDAKRVGLIPPGRTKKKGRLEKPALWVGKSFAGRVDPAEISEWQPAAFARRALPAGHSRES